MAKREQRKWLSPWEWKSVASPMTPAETSNSSNTMMSSWPSLKKKHPMNCSLLLNASYGVACSHLAAGHLLRKKP